MEEYTMSRDGGGTYSLPAGSTATDGNAAEASQHNNPLNDLENDMNTPRPIVAGGSGTSTVVGARTGFQIGANVLAKSANYTALLVDRSKLIKSTATLTLSLTAAATLLDGWFIDVRADTGTTTIDPNGAETIDGAATLALSVGQSCRVRCDGSNFTTQFKTEGIQQNLSKGADVASASALTLGADGNYFDITGTTGITSINTLGVGTVVILQFDGVLTMTHHATNLKLPGYYDITTIAGDEAVFVEYATGQWRCVSYLRVDSAPYYLIDEDDFASNSDRRVPSQQSVKAYISAQYATAAQWRANTTGKILTTDKVWDAAAFVTLTDAANISWNLDTGFNFNVTLAGNRVLDNPTNTKVGQSGMLEVIQDGTGSRTLSFGTSYESSGGSVPTLTTTANASDMLFYTVISSTRILITAVSDIS
jgi:hypothetical protein